MHRMPHLGVVERGETEAVACVHVVELHVELAAGRELAADFVRRARARSKLTEGQALALAQQQVRAVRRKPWAAQRRS